MEFHTSSGVLEITVISAEDLRSQNGRAINKNTSVTIRSDPSHHNTTKINTENEGGYSRWNEKLRLDLPSQATSITLEVHCKDTLVGSANIPVSDFMRPYIPANYLHFLSYRLRDHKGFRNGIINLSVRLMM